MTPEIQQKIQGYAEQYHNGSMAIACEKILLLKFVRKIAADRWFPDWGELVISEINNPFSWPPNVFDIAMKRGMKLPTESRFWEISVGDISNQEVVAIEASLYVEQR